MAHGQSNFWGQANYSIPGGYFVAQFDDSLKSPRIYCFNKKGEKVWLTNVYEYLLTLVLKDSTAKKLELTTAKYKNGVIDGIVLNRNAFKHDKAYRPIKINLADVFSITVQSSYAVESPYYDLDSSKKIWQRKTDSLYKHYSTGKEVILYFISKTKSKPDSLLIYENACYNISFKDNNHIEHGVVEKITMDSIYISTNFQYVHNDVNQEHFKIFKYLIRDIDELSLLKPGGYSYKKIDVGTYDILPSEIERNKLEIPCWFGLNPRLGKIELYRSILTLRGFIGIMEENGKYYWYE